MAGSIGVGGVSSQGAVKKNATAMGLKNREIEETFIVDVGKKGVSADEEAADIENALNNAVAARDRGKKVAVLFAFDPPIDPNLEKPRDEQPLSQVTTDVAIV